MRVCPHRDMYLVPAEKRDRRPDAMNRRPVTQMLLEIQTKPLLRSAANAKNDVPGPSLLYAFEEFCVGDSLPIYGSKIDIFVGYAYVVLTQPAKVALRTCSGWHNPETISMRPEFRLFNQGAKIG